MGCRPQRQTRKPVNYAAFEGSGSEEEEDDAAAIEDDRHPFKRNSGLGAY